ncbi:hypothetical protein NDA16_001046 [Ustilago loliicola]|nr:hypothetical protein NDA16_001046 [Ustilago loliicola]
MDPDSILADDANPDQVLGQESSDAAVKRNSSTEKSQVNGDDDDAAAALKRASAASAIFSQATNSPRLASQALSPDQIAAEPSASAPANHTDASASLANMSTEALQAQVKDLTNQVTGLNEKLVKSFNRIADLEDDYSDAQERIRNMSAKIKELEKERAEHLDALNTGLLVEKAHVSSEMQRMMDRVIEETAQRGKAESDKSKIEAELDELSSSLFSEANKMVAVERLSRARAEEKSRNMEERLKDTEGIMLEQQKVLADLQRQVEKLQISGSGSRKDGDDGASMITVESESVSFHRLKTSALARSISQRTATRERKHKPSVDPAADARLIINIVPYQEFRSFIAYLRKLRKQLAPFYTYPLPHGGRDSVSGIPTPRTASPAPQQATGASAPTNSIITASSAYSQGIGSAFVTSSPFAIAGVSRHRDYPTLPSNVENLVSLPSQLSLPFIKRSQEEDVEPCLRLDFAPGLNWLSRRQANTAILDGNLVIEPIFSGSKTIDEDAIRRENAHLPPAACAMCGIPVVNVPLPGGVAATSMSAEQGGKTSLVPSSIATATSSWASSAASSLGSITGSSSSNNSSSGTLTPKPSRGGLFSSFRKSSAQNKSAEQLDTTANSTASATPEAETQAIVPSEALVPSNLPVPTHIFRLSESSPTRYLLCPHHCLLRLRAVCQYWGFVRNLERSMVLEGKFMNEEQQQQAAAAAAAANASTDSLPKEIVGAKSEQVETLEKAVEDAEANRTESDKTEAEKIEDEKADVKEGETDKADAEKTDAEKTDAEKEEAEKTEAEKIKEKVQEEMGDDAKETGAEESSTTKKSEVAEDTEAEKKTGGDDDDFADAPSSPTEAKAEEATKEGESSEDVTAAATETTAETSADKADAPAIEAADAAEKPTEVDTAEKSTEADASGAPAPPLPPRSVARGAGASSPSPAGAGGVTPKIPPRRYPPRPVPAAPAGAPTLPPRTSTPAISPAATALYLDKLDSMEWEDKMWTEVTKLKEELWRARIGLVTEDSELI